MAREKKKIRHAEQKQPQVVLQQNNVQITNEKVANEKQQQKEPQPNTQNSSKNLDSGYGKDIKGKLIYYLYMDTQILPR